MAHSICGCKCEWQIKLCDSLLTCAIPECLRDEQFIIQIRLPLPLYIALHHFNDSLQRVTRLRIDVK